MLCYLVNMFQCLCSPAWYAVVGYWVVLVSRNATKNSKLAFMVYGADTTSRELIGQATLNLSDVMQKHRSKSECFWCIGVVMVPSALCINYS